MLDEASDFLWKNYGIPVGTQDYRWDNDRLIVEAVKKGWKFSI